MYLKKWGSFQINDESRINPEAFLVKTVVKVTGLSSNYTLS